MPRFLVSLIVINVPVLQRGARRLCPVRRAYRLDVASISFGSSGNSVSSHSLAFS
jgi:hypothetical protein